ncbi:uncharacterized protein [Typha latifolia]|uniref:uncharacterized protein n=1 Tax=Typha latifolia TaxID=4733 RepID=UPI003C2ECA13
MDPSEPRWRMNSSFSPPTSRRWDCRFQSDGLPQITRDASINDSLSLLSDSKRNISELGSEQYPNHYHSISDGALSDLDSTSSNFQARRWTSLVQSYDLGEFSTPSGGARPETFVYPPERHFAGGNSFGSLSSLSDSSQWASSSKHPIFVPPRNYSGRRPFMSKPVYPLVFRNPVSDAEAAMLETSYGGRITSGDGSTPSPSWPAGAMSPELKFHRNLNEQRMEASPETNRSSREGFRWSNASSDFGHDDDNIVTDHIGLENQRCSSNPVRYQRCGLCERMLWQQSPWSSNRIVRSSDMPVAGVLPCHHVFHADCLEKTTHKSQIHEPPCPLCLRSVNVEGGSSFSEPLYVALRSARRNKGISAFTSTADGSNNLNPVQNEGDVMRNKSLPLSRRGNSLMRSNFRKRFSFKGKIGKDLFRAKVFRRPGSSSLSSSVLRDEQNQPEDSHETSM